MLFFILFRKFERLFRVFQHKYTLVNSYMLAAEERKDKGKDITEGKMARTYIV
jgi:hypothetical protein